LRLTNWRSVPTCPVAAVSPARLRLNPFLSPPDGIADGKGSHTFTDLAAGDYSIFTGRSDYLAQSISNPNFPSKYGVTGADSGVVPEPETYAMLLAGLDVIGAVIPHNDNWNQQEFSAEAIGYFVLFPLIRVTELHSKEKFIMTRFDRTLGLVMLGSLTMRLLIATTPSAHAAANVFDGKNFAIIMGFKWRRWISALRRSAYLEQSG
jgi:hypothetical protein